MKFLITGAAGLVGSQVTKDLTEKHTVYSCYNNSKPKDGIPIKLDLTITSDIKTTLNKIKPDRIIHLAAMTNVDLCETQQDMATKINVTATKTLALEAAKLGVFFVYVSTDYVFDGKKGMKKENDIPNPLGFYGKSKLAGEIALNKLSSSYAIARTSTPFGLHKTKKSFPIWIKESLESKKEIPVLVDLLAFVPSSSSLICLLDAIVSCQDLACLLSAQQD